MLVSTSGLISSGKDTVADHLIQHYGFVKLSFADSLKDTLTSIFGWDREMLEGKTKEHREERDKVDVWWAKELGIPNFTPRFALTKFGTDVMRNHFDDRIWLLSVKNKITSIKKKDPKVNIVISDARYTNELNMLRELDAVLFEIIRGPLPEWWNSAIGYNKCNNKYERILYKLFTNLFSIDNKTIFNQNVHSSEYDWIGYKFDYTLYNNGTIKDLTNQVNLYYLLSNAK